MGSTTSLDSQEKLETRYSEIMKSPREHTVGDVLELLHACIAMREALTEVAAGDPAALKFVESESVNVRGYFRELLLRMPHLPNSDVVTVEKSLEALPKVGNVGGRRFTADWFSKHEGEWESTLAHLKGRPHLRFLELGSFEGLSTCWTLENILTHETSRITCVDTFRIPWANPDWSDEALQAHFEHNIAQIGAAHKVTKIVGFSQEVLRTLPLSEPFDHIYIDASHVACDVLEDAVLSWRLLKPDGIVTFDDYEKPFDDPLLAPKMGIDAFLEVFEGQYALVRRGYQLAVRKMRPR